jgi:hypothetical protein
MGEGNSLHSSRSIGWARELLSRKGILLNRDCSRGKGYFLKRLVDIIDWL